MGRKLLVVLRTWYTRPFNWIFGAVLALMAVGLVIAASNPFKRSPQMHYRVHWTNHSLRSDRLTRADLESDVDLSERMRNVQHLWLQNVIPNADGRGYTFSRVPLTKAQLDKVLPHCRSLKRLQLEAELERDAWQSLASVPHLQSLEFRNLGFTNTINLRGFPPIPELRMVDLELVDWVNQIGHVARQNPWIERVVIRDIDVRDRDGQPLDLSAMPKALREVKISPAMEQTNEPPYIPKWRPGGAPTLSAGWKYSDISQELLQGLARLPNLKKVWLHDIDVRDWGQAAASAALPGKDVQQVVTLQTQPSPFLLGAMPLLVFPLILATLQVGQQFAHPLSRTIPGYAAPHLWVFATYLLVPIGFTTAAMRLSGGAWLASLAVGLFGTASMLWGMGFAHVAKNPRLANLGGLIPIGAVMAGALWLVNTPEALLEFMTGEWPVLSGILGLIGLGACGAFVARLSQMPCRFEEAGMRNIFGHPFDGPGWKAPQMATANSPAAAWMVRMMPRSGRHVLERKQPLCLLGTLSERSELIAVASGLDTARIIMAGLLLPLVMWLSMGLGPLFMMRGEAMWSFVVRGATVTAPIGFSLVLFMIGQCWIMRRSCFSFETTHPLTRDEYWEALSRAIGRQYFAAFWPMAGWAAVMFGVVHPPAEAASAGAFPLYACVLAGTCLFAAGALQWLLTEHRLWVRFLVVALLGYTAIGILVATNVGLLETAPLPIRGSENLVRIAAAGLLALGGRGLSRWARHRWNRTEWGMAMS